MKTQILEEDDNNHDGSEEVEIDTDENEDSEDNRETENGCKPKLRFPPSAATQEMFFGLAQLQDSVRLGVPCLASSRQVRHL